MNEQIEKAQQTWDNIDINKIRDVSWSSITYFNHQKNKRLTANYTVTFASLLQQRYSPQELKTMQGLALVCGDMAAERAYFEQMSTDISFATVHGYDLSPESVKRFSAEKFEFIPHIMDVNDLVLPNDSFDVVVANHGIHHVYNLGGLFYQTHKAINQRGIFILEEWIGPPYLQIPLLNHIAASLLLFLLFPFRKTRTNHDGRVKGIWLQYSPKTFDPSEACNSNELMPQLLRYFKPIRIVTYGGLIYPMFEGVGHKIDENLLVNKIRIRIVYYLEIALTKLRIIKPLFVYGIMEKREDIRKQYNLSDFIAKYMAGKKSL